MHLFPAMLSLLSLPARAESPRCDCMGTPLLTGAPPCVETVFGGCYLGTADTALRNQCGSELTLVDLPVHDGLGGVCGAAPCVVAPGETANFINSIGTYTLQVDGQAHSVHMNRGCEPGMGGAGGGGAEQGSDDEKADSPGCATVRTGPLGILVPGLAIGLVGMRRRQAPV